MERRTIWLPTHHYLQELYVRGNFPAKGINRGAEVCVGGIGGARNVLGGCDLSSFAKTEINAAVFFR